MSIGAGVPKTLNGSHLREVNVKKILAMVALLLFSTIFLYCSKPTIEIKNKTLDDVFVFFGVSEKDVDPDYEQIKQSRRALKVSQGKSIKVSISLFDYFISSGQVNIGWRVGGMSESTIKRVGYSTFNIVSNSKRCSIVIDIYNSKDEVLYQDKTFCIKSLEFTSNYDG